MKLISFLRASLPSVLFLFFAVSCSEPAPDDGNGPSIAVSIDPLAFVVRQIVPDDISVEVLLPAGQSPATYDPTPQQMARLSDADVFFTVGVPFETRILNYFESNPGTTWLVDTREGIELRYMTDHGHDHGEGSEAPDPHVWLDPNLAKQQAEIICSTLCVLDTARCLEFRENLSALKQSLDSVHARVQALLGPARGRRMYVYHPAYGYFTDAYGLEQVAVEASGKEPSARQLGLLLDDAKSDDITTLFVQPQFSSSQARAVAAELGAEIVELDPIAPDYIENLMEMAQKVARSYGLEVDSSETAD